MWRCYRCETYNDRENCFICGLAKNTPLPVKIPVNMYQGKTSTTIKPQNVPLFRNLDDDHMVPAGKEKSGSPLLIAAIIIVAIIVLYIIAMGL